MSLSTTLTERAAVFLDNTTSRRGFLNRAAMTGSAVAAAGVTYATRPTSAYAAVCGCNGRTCDCTDLCCDGYTEFCCQLHDSNSCPPNTILAGWWKVDNSSYCAGAARYYMDCNKSSPGCGCGATGVCRDGTACQCRSCGNRKDGCTVFRYGNCNNNVSCVGPIMCRVVTCSKPWEVDPGCSTVSRTDENTRWHHRECLVDPRPDEFAFVEALYRDFLGRPSDPNGKRSHANRMVQYRGRGNRGRDVIGRAFAYSPEYLSVVVHDLYQMALSRNADPTGLSSYRTALIEGRKTRADIAIELVLSDEFWGKAGKTEEGFVRRCYERMLGRSPAPSEVTLWVDRRHNGWSRREIASGFYNAVESRRRRVVDLYERFLARSPGTAGLDHWVPRLLSEDDVVCALSMVESPEYYNRAQRRFG